MNLAIIKEPTILVTSAVYAILALVVALAGPLFGLWLGVLLLLSFWRFSYSVLRSVAQGHKRIPPPDTDSFNPIGHIAEIFHFVAFPGLVLATAPYQPFGAAVAVLASVAFPASAALMALTSNLAQAFNPTAMIELARTFGRDYATLVVGTVAIVLLAGLVATLIVPRLVGFAGVVGASIPLTGLLAVFVLIWATLSVFALIGSVLRAHRLDFEIAGEIVPAEERTLAHRHAEWRKTLDIAYASFRSGILSSGYRTLERLVDDNGDSLEVNHWLVENMLEWEDKKFGLEAAARLMPRLLAAEDGAGALDLYRRWRRYDPEIRLAAADAERLAAYALAFGHPGLAAELGARSQL